MTLGPFAESIFRQKYSMEKKENWFDCADRTVYSVCGDRIEPSIIERIRSLVRQRKLMPGGRYLYAAGRPFHQTNNCFLFRAHDSREGWADLMYRVTSALMTGGGIGVVYSDVRGEGFLVKGMGGLATGPIALAQMVNEAGRGIRQGGSRRAAIWAGLHWWHPDIEKFVTSKNWPEWLAERKRIDFDTAAPLDMTNISVILDDEFFEAFYDSTHPKHALAVRVYWLTVRQGCLTGEPGFSVDCGINAGENLRNACTEVTSADDNDVCNLISINLARVESKAEFENCVEMGIIFALCGSQYSLLPFDRIEEIRTKNRRLGLGLMGIHEWLLTRDKCYGPDSDLRSWLQTYRQSTDIARHWANKMGVSPPVKTRAIAPTGTISIIAETTSGCEPVFALALKRRWLKGSKWHANYIIDATAKRLIDRGVHPSRIETSYDLAYQVERRILMQAWLQQFVDHGISSTINLPRPGIIDHEKLGGILIKYLPRVRGITMYPDGARGGQPLVPVGYEEARDKENIEIEEMGEIACPSGVCGV